MKKTISKFVNLPIFPFLVLVFAKFLAVALLMAVYEISFNSDNILFLFGLKLEDAISTYANEISTYSDMVAYLALSTGFLLNVSKYTNNKGNILSKANIKVFEKNRLKNYLKIARSLYGNTIFWLISIWLATFFITYNVLVGLTFVWLFLVVVIVSIAVSLIFNYDLKQEVELSKDKLI